MEKKGIYTPPLCVWKVIEESASPEKHSIIRSLIGISKLEYAADLRIEVPNVCEITLHKRLDSNYAIPITGSEIMVRGNRVAFGDQGRPTKSRPK